ncbi:flavohemoprotein [Vibrio maritimus]|uniref:nitric oxide dioxygenase n=1 Tax=Vibrio maritimus TaxID=990268 RepID=A0A090T3V9_9VIBR|nr:flavohemoprotein [Vibrio maritimus]
MHRELNVGSTLDVMPPAGDFFYQPSDAPVVLISAGVGCTPMQAMLQQVGKQDSSQQLTYLHACENEQQHSFFDETATILAANGWQQHTWYREPQGKHEATNCHNGMMDLSAIKDSLPVHLGEFYLCGPVGFMQAVVAQLEAMDVERSRIHYEVFGPHANL